MFPDAFQIGPLSVNFYGLMIALGAGSGLALYSLTAPWRNIPPSVLRDVCFWLILAGIVGARLFHVIFNWAEFSDNLGGIFAYWRGGLMFQGGLFLAVALSPMVLKYYGLPFWSSLDVSVPSLALGHALGRLGCLGIGCCYGELTTADNPLAIYFPLGAQAPSACPLWPTQLMEFFGLFIIALILLSALKSSSRFFQQPGKVAGLYLFLAGFLRLFVEYFRGDFRGEAILWGLPPTTVMAALVIILGIWILGRGATPKKK